MKYFEYKCLFCSIFTCELNAYRFIESAISLFEQKSLFLVEAYGGDCNIGKI